MWSSKNDFISHSLLKIIPHSHVTDSTLSSIKLRQDRDTVLSLAIVSTRGEHYSSHFNKKVVCIAARVIMLPNQVTLEDPPKTLQPSTPRSETDDRQELGVANELGMGH